ncbi:MAG: hypothetical protein U0703_04625 [Anaerolineae bacterium]
MPPSVPGTRRTEPVSTPPRPLKRILDEDTKRVVERARAAMPRSSSQARLPV